MSGQKQIDLPTFLSNGQIATRAKDDAGSGGAGVQDGVKKAGFSKQG